MFPWCHVRLTLIADSRSSEGDQTEDLPLGDAWACMAMENYLSKMCCHWAAGCWCQNRANCCPSWLASAACSPPSRRSPLPRQRNQSFQCILTAAVGPGMADASDVGGGVTVKADITSLFSWHIVPSEGSLFPVLHTLRSVKSLVLFIPRGGCFSGTGGTHAMNVKSFGTTYLHWWKQQWLISPFQYCNSLFCMCYLVLRVL